MSTKNVNRSLTNLLLDIALTAGFVVSLWPSLTGLALHEWLGLAVGAGLIVHLVRHWKWVVGVTRQFLGKLPIKTRVLHTLDAMLLLSFLCIIGSGVAMSGAVLPVLGLSGGASFGWFVVHKLASSADPGPGGGQTGPASHVDRPGRQAPRGSHGPSDAHGAPARGL